MANINDEFDFNATFADGSQIKDRQIRGIMRGLRAAKREVGPSMARNLLYVWGLMLIVGIMVGGGALVFMLSVVALTKAGDWLFGPMVATNFFFTLMLPAMILVSFLWLSWHLYWRSRSDRSGI